MFKDHCIVLFIAVMASRALQVGVQMRFWLFLLVAVSQTGQQPTLAQMQAERYVWTSWRGEKLSNHSRADPAAKGVDTREVREEKRERRRKEEIKKNKGLARLRGYDFAIWNIPLGGLTAVKESLKRNFDETDLRMKWAAELGRLVLKINHKHGYKYKDVRGKMVGLA
ncbi:unnamed protein product [Vitrella brassicaformis CCMP3155]|uniref:Uncharacterized protein n=1 Tax=Vitrella brassicaformis (strain CCMP3155) TaxID=1169540 RepID=A0A0G4EA46_VITBC|nr:unnamed protein product [Vitrella brassicaformis CCMP3155]|eukprot:CEL92111.1 unnamed protein product [Vitrella brassicaformis CCMP3155]